MSLENCEICRDMPYKYTCPRCGIFYCSVLCYKSQEHLKCSEEFYKQCVSDELRSTTQSSNNNGDMRKIYEILKRIRETDAGAETESFGLDGLDSEEDKSESNSDVDEAEDAVDEDIAQRLKGIDINNADEVWEILTSTEREEFQKLVSSGDIMKLMPNFRPWWLKNKNSKIVVLKCNDKETKSDIPKAFDNISKFSSLCSKEPSPCLHYNLWNVLAAYSYTVRYFNGEHAINHNEATSYLVNLSSTLKYGTNFETVEDAIISVEMEAATTGGGATQLMEMAGVSNFLVEDFAQLKSDSKDLMRTLQNKLSALSDILRLFQLTKKSLDSGNKTKTEFQKLFALSSGMEELTPSKIKLLIKKITFYLSYVNRENEPNLCS